jgi:hypothetical protein
MRRNETVSALFASPSPSKTAFPAAAARSSGDHGGVAHRIRPSDQDPKTRATVCRFVSNGHKGRCTMSLSALPAASGSGGKWRKVALFGEFREFFALAERPSTAAAAGSSGVTAELFLEFGHAPFEVRVLRNALVSISPHPRFSRGGRPGGASGGVSAMSATCSNLDAATSGLATRV